jgi:hypothetical protein
MRSAVSREPIRLLPPCAKAAENARILTERNKVGRCHAIGVDRASRQKWIGLNQFAGKKKREAKCPAGNGGLHRIVTPFGE